MTDIIIIGGGPAGISASLYTVRAGLDTKIIYKGIGALKKAEKIDNFYGKSLSGSTLFKNGLKQAENLGVSLIKGEVVGIDYDGSNFTLSTATDTYISKAVIIATGAGRTAPKIKGLQQFEGKGISYCAVCDGFFYRGKDVAVLGSGTYALHEAAYLAQIAKSVTILTNGAKATAKLPKNTVKKKIAEIMGEKRVQRVIFEDGTTLDTDGVFVAQGVADSTALAKKLGAMTKGNSIGVDNNMATNIPGLYAAGDCTGGLYQISKAVYDGTKAANHVIKYIKSKSR